MNTSLNSIKSNVIEQTGCDEEIAVDIAEQIFKFQCSGSSREMETPRHEVENDQQVHFQESLYKVDEEDKFESHVAAEFEKDNYQNTFSRHFTRRGEAFDFSHIHFTTRPGYVKLLGFCVDTGALRSVLGKRQLNYILRITQNKLIPRMPSGNTFKFGDVTVKSLGMIELDLKTPAPRRPIPVLLDIVPVDVPALLGLDVLDAEGLYADNVTNRIVHRHVTSKPGEPLSYQDLWCMPLIRYDGHLYAGMCFPTTTFYTVKQLEKLHRQFAHPSAEKLYNLLKTAGLKAVDASTHKLLEDIAARCEPCQRIRNAPRRFRVTLGQENVRFNADVYVDIMYIDGRPVLHIVDGATRFSAARFLPKVSTESIWEAIILCWSSIYTGLSHTIRVDEGSQFRKIFAELSALHQFNVKKSGIEADNSPGLV